MIKWKFSLFLVVAALLIMSLIPPLAYAKDSGAPLPQLASLSAGKGEPKRTPADLAAKLSPELKAQYAALKARIEAVKKGENYVKGERLVFSKGGVGAQKLDAAIAKVKVTGVKEVAKLGTGKNQKIIKLVKFGSEAQAAEAAAKLKQDPSVLYVVKNIKFSAPEPKQEVVPSKPQPPQVKAQVATADPLRPLQYALDKIKDNLTPRATGAAPWVAVIDTGVQYDHPDLNGQVELGWDYVNDDDDPMDDNGHGTNVAGIIAAKVNNALGIAGISPKSKIYAIKVLDDVGEGEWDDVIAGMEEARDNPDVKILNLSLCGYVDYPSAEYDAMEALIDEIVAADKIVVCAAGNDSNLMQYAYDDLGTDEYEVVPIPATIPGSFTVAATNEYDYRASFSNYSSSTTVDPTTHDYVDIAAPGCNILSLDIDDGYASMSGTSQATPIVSAVAARVWAANPTWEEDDVRGQLQTTGKTLGTLRGFPVSVKRVDILKALGKTATGVQGQVINAETGLPLPGAQVKVGALSAYTNNGGFYTLKGVTPGVAVTVVARKAGFVSTSKAKLTVVAGQITDDVNFYLTTTQPLGVRTVVVEWGSMDPGSFEWEAWVEGFEHPDLPGVDAMTLGREMNTYFKIMPDDIVISWENPEEANAELLLDSYDVWKPVETLRYRAAVGKTYFFGEGMSPYDWCWGRISVPAGAPAEAGAVAQVYTAGVLTSTITSMTATGTADFWWQPYKQVGIAVPTPPNVRFPLLGAVITAGASVILVDDDYGDDYQEWYVDALNDVGVSQSYWSVELAGPPSKGDLATHKIAIWETGDCSSETLTRYERDTIETRLTSLVGAGRVFLSGQGIGYNLADPDGFGTPEALEFYNDVLKADYLVDSTELYGLIGVNGDPISDPEGAGEGNELAIVISGGTGADNQLWPDGIAPFDEAALTVFEYLDDNGDPSGVYGAIRRMITVSPTVKTRLVYFSFGFEGINDAADRALLMEKIVAWLLLP